MSAIIPQAPEGIHNSSTPRLSTQTLKSSHEQMSHRGGVLGTRAGASSPRRFREFFPQAAHRRGSMPVRLLSRACQSDCVAPAGPAKPHGKEPGTAPGGGWPRGRSSGSSRNGPARHARRELLHRPDVVAIHQQVRGERVWQVAGFTSSPAWTASWKALWRVRSYR